MRSPEEREALREARRQARLLAGTTRRLELPVAPDEALDLLKEAVQRRDPMMRMQRYTSEKAVVTVSGGTAGIPGFGGNIGAVTTLLGGGIGVPVSWVPFGDGTQYIATARSVGEMFIMRTEIQSLWRALVDAWDARERWEAQRSR